MVEFRIKKRSLVFLLLMVGLMTMLLFSVGLMTGIAISPSDCSSIHQPAAVNPDDSVISGGQEHRPKAGSVKASPNPSLATETVAKPATPTFSNSAPTSELPGISQPKIK